MKKLICFLTLILSLSVLSAQDINAAVTKSQQELSTVTADADHGATALVPDAQMAMSSPDYPVTAGDIYTLAFAVNNTPVTYVISVDTSYKIRVANITVLDVTGKTFLQLKRLVEQIVTENYHLSGVQFLLTTPAVFKVTLNGEVNQTEIKQAWALSRLSNVVSGSFTPYSSMRNIVITSASKKSATYDLFKASRFGDLSQDPYVRPGDIITINRLERKVTVSGAVERPGTYELLKGENLTQLVNYYGGGLTTLADTSRISLSRALTAAADSGGEKIYLTEKDISADYVLLDMDSVSIGTKSSLRPYMMIEGIITTDTAGGGNGKQAATADMTDQKTPNTYLKQPVQFLPNDNYADLVRAHANLFNEHSDLEHAYINRNDQRLMINLEQIVYDPLFKSEYTVQAGDRLIVPFQQALTKVHVEGEVSYTFEKEAWPLIRLSSLLNGEGILTPYSSTRNVQITTVDGTTTTYDLFKASRFGDLSQNPYVRAGSTVTVQRMERKVTVSGAVERPGTYELLKGENLTQLVNYYGGGLVDRADTSRMQLVRTLNQTHPSGEMIYLDDNAIDTDYQLYCYDSISIPTYLDLKPVMFMEGALYSSTGTAPEASTRITINFQSGENYATLIRANRTMFSATSDTANAYIIRGDKTIPVDIDKILFDASYYSNEAVQPYDTLMVPFRQYFVSVAGAVNTPGRYPYIPGRTWEYYIGLAGGFMVDKNAGQAITIKDIQGTILQKSDPITPETTITAATNSFTYYFGKYSPVITTILSILSTTLTIIAVTK
ncbi:MAG: SLBB domain-containing protein [Treponema sp.]|nr:SLBB domain-containing protein [Treponema sp.]